ncbi:hypothetical protein D3C71_1835260 [compost metagenome]
MNVAELDDTLAVQTAGHHRSIDQHGGLSSQRMAEAFAVIFRRAHAGPLELVVLVKKDALGDLDAASGHDLLFDPVVQAERFFQHGQRRTVPAPLQVRQIIRCQIPQPEGNVDALRGGLLGKFDDLPQIALAVL